MYSADKCGTEKFYYQALQINVSVSGHYSFASRIANLTHGYLYRDTFDPFDPSRTEITSNKEGCDRLKFLLYFFLQANTTYILVITTYNVAETGPFFITAVGTDTINFTLLGESYCSQVRTRWVCSSSRYSIGFPIHLRIGIDHG